jgi:hypothetical protein
MKVYVIEDGARIRIRNSDSGPIAGAKRTFTSGKQLRRVTSDMPLSQLVQIWNHLPGVRPIRRFTSRDSAVNRIWKVVRTTKPRAIKSSQLNPGSQKRESETRGSLNSPCGAASRVIALLKTEQGASLQQLADAVGWQKHSIRALLSSSIRRKYRMNVISTRNAEGTRIYRVT